MTISEFNKVFTLAIRQYRDGLLTAPRETLIRDLLAGINNQEKGALGAIKYDSRDYSTLIAARRRQSREFRLRRAGDNA